MKKAKQEKVTAFYEVAPEEDAFAVQRNGRYLMTPAGKAFRVPTLGVAEAVAQEWREQTDKIDPKTMPMTQLVATALDIVSKEREKITLGLLGYIGSELLCHRAQSPSSLVAKQNEIWGPYLDWCRTRYDICFEVGEGIMPIVQNDEIKQRLRVVLEACDDFKFAGLSAAVDCAGSLILGLALAEGFKTADDVFAASELDFAHQALTWGDDPVTLARQASVRQELESCQRWFGLLG